MQRNLMKEYMRQGGSGDGTEGGPKFKFVVYYLLAVKDQVLDLLSGGVVIPMTSLHSLPIMYCTRVPVLLSSADWNG